MTAINVLCPKCETPMVPGLPENVFAPWGGREQSVHCPKCKTVHNLGVRVTTA
jgi:RNase P subunit RPR2